MKVRRRNILLGIGTSLALAGLSPIAAHSVSLVDLQGLGATIDSAASALGKLADSVAHAISLGDKGYSVVSARETKAKLKDLDARLSDLAQTSQSTLVQNIRQYADLASRAPDANDDEREQLRNQLQSSWQKVVDGVRDIIARTQALLDELRNDRSDFVLESARGALLHALDAKIGVLEKLRAGAFPESAEQINELKIIADKFDQLRQKTIEALAQMSSYIAKIEG